jgi:hypothetical protein
VVIGIVEPLLNPLTPRVNISVSLRFRRLCWGIDNVYCWRRWIKRYSCGLGHVYRVVVMRCDSRHQDTTFAGFDQRK